MSYPAFLGLKRLLATVGTETVRKIRHFRPILNRLFTVTGKKSGRGLRTAPVSICR